MKTRNKIFIFPLIIFVTIIIFTKQCTPVNISIGKILKSRDYSKYKSLKDVPNSKNYEIIPIDADFPIFYDSIQNVFYLTKDYSSGLCRIDGQGNIIYRDSLLGKEDNSLMDFENHSYFVFTKKGVYDYSQKNIKLEKMDTVINKDQNVNEGEWDEIFEDLYKHAKIVIYESDRLGFEKCECSPIYFKMKDRWILLYTRGYESRLTSMNMDLNSTYGKVNFTKFPAKFPKLILLKDSYSNVYSSRNLEDDKYFKTYFSITLDEEKLDYEEGTNINMDFYEKDDYYSLGNPFDLPRWMLSTYIGTAYYSVQLKNENVYIKEKEIKYKGNVKNNFSCFEVPSKFKNRAKVNFLYYKKTVSKGLFDTDIGSLHLIRKKSK
jgi:hypothetical protein